jgi:hypothetical protein
MADATTVLKLHKAPLDLVHKLKIAAIKQDMTLNDFCVRLLEQAVKQPRAARPSEPAA